MSSKIVFRAEASVAIGIGHVMRCLTLADRLAANGAEIAFACSSATVETVPGLTYPIVDDRDGGDILVIDHYGLGEEYERAARTSYRRIMVIDDLPNRRHDCDLLLDQTAGRAPEQWRPLVPAHARLLTGGQYALLRPEFERTPCRPRSSLDAILIGLGGTDPGNATELALEGIRLSRLTASVTVVLGGRAPHLQSVKAKAQTMNGVTVLTDVAAMADLMDQADLAIGAGGTSAWERCRLGLPSLMLEIAANQKDVIRALVQAGAAVHCPTDASAMAATLRHLHESPDSLTRLSANAATVCPGNGAERVAQILLNLESERS